MIRPRSAPFLPNSSFDSPSPSTIAAKPSLWIWISYIWLLFASSRTLSTWLAGGRPGRLTELEAAGSPLDRMLMIVLILLGLLVLGLRTKQTKEILANNKWVIVLFVFMALSVLWSNFPEISLRRCIRSMGTFVMVLVVLTERSPLEAMRRLLRALFLVHIPLSIIAIKYFRYIGVVYNWNGSEEEWAGISTDKNSLGQIAMCSGLFCAWQILQEWPKNSFWGNVRKSIPSGLLLLLSLWLLRGSKNIHSSTAIIGFVVCVAVLIGLQYIRKRAAMAKRIIVMGTTAACLLGPIVYLAFSAFDTTPVQTVFEATGRDMTFTGRTYLWSDIIDDTARNPVLGVGIGAFWVGPIGYRMYPLVRWSRITPDWRPEQGHNGYIDVYAQLGAVGVVILLILIGGGLVGAFGDLETEFLMGSLRLTLLLSIIMNNVTESSFLRGEHGLWFLFLLVNTNIPASIRNAGSGISRRLRTAITDSAEADAEAHHKTSPSRLPSFGLSR